MSSAHLYWIQSLGNESSPAGRASINGVLVSLKIIIVFGTIMLLQILKVNEAMVAIKKRNMIWLRKTPPLVMFAVFTTFFFTMVGCKKKDPALFKFMPSEKTGIDFINKVKEGLGKNILESEFFYNGGGVAVGDINNDRLVDIYFTANTGGNALYINQGDFKFTNIAKEAGVIDSTGWSAGTSMVDINGDGLLDIYVCKAGKENAENRRNKLFINNGGGTFTEESAKYGLDDPGYGTQAAFFDYDRDGDLDAFIVNYSVKSYTGFNLITIRKDFDPYAGDKLYRNDNGIFTDVSQQAGIQQNPIGFGLSATVSDFNKDGWPDIFVTNDFIERDYMYINQGDGTFHDEILSRTDLTSYFSMGSDVADINNDGLLDILSVDMLPYNYTRRKVFKTPDYSMYDQLTAQGYHRQNMRNVLQVNNGNGTFTEVGRLAGVSKTDWSWAPLIADFDNDGKKDIYITNGFPRFYTNLDFLHNVLWKKYPEERLPENSKILYELVRQMPQVKLNNFAFKNTGHLSFTNVSQKWGVNRQAVSNGAAYADLDNNGTLDLIINNFNKKAFIYKNNSLELNKNRYLKIHLQGSGKNTFGLGTNVRVTADDGSNYFQQAFPVRGFQSSVSPSLLFGVEDHKHVNVQVTWPDQSQDSALHVATNQALTFNQDGAKIPQSIHSSVGNSYDKQFLFLSATALGLNYNHQGSLIQLDRIRAPLMPHTLTNLGPALAKGDINNDGLTDVFVGGGPGQSAGMYLQGSDGTFSHAQIPALESDKKYDDINGLFLDANGDGRVDLYVVSGGNSNPRGPLYQDRLYINDGSGRFIRDSEALPRMYTSGSCVKAADYDEDGDLDLFVGGRVVNGQYPLSPRSYILKNNNGHFTDVTEQLSPELLKPGMITDAAWADIDNDNKPELILAGEWMPIRIFKNNGGGKSFSEITKAAGLDKTAGWWNVLKVADLDGNGNLDLIAGNRGLNSSLNATEETPVFLFAGYFNNDGLIDPIVTQVIQGHRYPVAGRDLLLHQLPNFKKKFPDYATYSTATIYDILTGSQLQQALRLNVDMFVSAAFKNMGDGTFQILPLPREAQFSPIFAMVIADFDGDSIPDILAAGNNFGNRPEDGPSAGDGILLKGKESFGFISETSRKTGFYAIGDIRNMEILSSKIGPLLLLSRNNESLIPYIYQKQH